MPVISTIFQDTTQNIDKPVVLSVLKDLIRLNVLPKSKKTIYHEVVKSSKVPGRDNAGQITNPHPHRSGLLGDDIMIVEVDREPIELPGLSMKSMYHEGTPLIGDDRLGLSVIPVYDNVTYKVNMVYTSSSRNKLQEFRERLRALLFTGNEVNLHRVEFSLALPDAVSHVVNEVYRLREGNAGYGQTMAEYMLEAGNSNIIIATDGSGTSGELRWTINQLDVEGYYEDTDLLDLADNEDATYTMELPYTFTINKPLMVKFKYPLVVHNQLMNKELIDPGVQEVEGKTKSLDTTTNSGFDNNSRLVNNPFTEYPVINPSVDPYRVDTNIHGFFPIVQSLCLVGDDKKQLLSLDALGKNIVYDKMGDYITNTGKDFITNKFESLFHVRLFINGKIRHMDRLAVNDDLIVSSKKELNPRDMHHVVLYSVYDFNYLSQRALERLLEHRSLMHSIAFSAFHSGLISEFVYRAIVGTWIDFEGNPHWLDGISTVRGYRFLQRVLLDSTPAVKSRPHSATDKFDTIYETDDLSISNELYQRTTQIAHTATHRREK